MREKYIEEKFPRYFEFGQSAEGLVDVASTLIDPVASVSPEQAKVLIADRDKVLDMLIVLAQKVDEVDPDWFTKVWYG